MIINKNQKYMKILKLLLLSFILIVSCNKPSYVSEYDDILSELDNTMELYCNSNPIVSNINKTTQHYSKNFIPFFDYLGTVGISANVGGCVGVSGRVILDINNNDIPDRVMSVYGLNGCNDINNHAQIKVYIDNQLKYEFESPSFGSRKMSFGDFNGDGKDDIVLFEPGEDFPPFRGAIVHVVFLNDTSYEIKQLDTPSLYYHSGTVGDVDNDGDIDIIPMAPRNDVYVHLNDGNGNFTKQKIIEANDVATGLVTELYDIDKDGNLDIIFGGHEWKEFDEWQWKNTILFGNGDGSFTKNKITLPPSENWGVITDFDFYDLDGDSVDEIIVTRTGGSMEMNYDFNNGFYQGFQIQILKQNGNQYDEFQILNAPDGWIDNTWVDWIPWTFVQDIDGDCILDIIPDSERLNDTSFELLSKWRGLYYKGSIDGKFMIEYIK